MLCRLCGSVSAWGSVCESLDLLKWIYFRNLSEIRASMKNRKKKEEEKEKEGDPERFALYITNAARRETRAILPPSALVHSNLRKQSPLCFVLLYLEVRIIEWRTFWCVVNGVCSLISWIPAFRNHLSTTHNNVSLGEIKHNLNNFQKNFC